MKKWKFTISPSILYCIIPDQLHSFILPAWSLQAFEFAISDSHKQRGHFKYGKECEQTHRSENDYRTFKGSEETSLSKAEYVLRSNWSK